MKVTLLHNTPLWVCARAIRTCWDSHDKSDTGFVSKGGVLVGVCGAKDKELIERVGNKNKHSSTLEHLTYSFEIDGISRACLQELARHRIASLSVKSSRYTLKELKDVDFEFVISPFGVEKFNYDKLNKFCALEYVEDSIAIAEAIRNVQSALGYNKSNDIIKYMIPEAFRTRLVWTINARSLQNFLSLRTSKSALREIRDLALEVFKTLPADHKYLFEDFIKEN